MATHSSMRQAQVVSLKAVLQCGEDVNHGSASGAEAQEVRAETLICELIATGAFEPQMGKQRGGDDGQRLADG